MVWGEGGRAAGFPGDGLAGRRVASVYFVMVDLKWKVFKETNLYLLLYILKA